MSSEAIRTENAPRNLDVRRTGETEPASIITIDLLGGVRVNLEARLGDAPMTLEELMGLKAGAVVALETGLADHVDLYLNDMLVARGEIVVVGNKYGVRISELASRP